MPLITLRPCDLDILGFLDALDTLGFLGGLDFLDNLDDPCDLDILGFLDALDTLGFLGGLDTLGFLGGLETLMPLIPLITYSPDTLGNLEPSKTFIRTTPDKPAMGLSSA